MTTNGSAMARGNLAVVTGAAGGIGLAAARAFHDRGLRVCLVDLAGDALDAAVAAMGGGAIACPCDVADAVQVATLAREIAMAHGPVSILMNNAGIGAGGDVFADGDVWRRVLDVNLFGVLNGIRSFVPAMIDGDAPGIVVATGSKQGITQPPGNTAYNVSKSGVKALTEGLAHTLRQRTGDRVTAHLLIPGYTFTGMTARGATDRPSGAWTAAQVVDRMLDGIAAGDFYILCQDDETTLDQDRRRIAWAAGDLIDNRPALSRWHPDWADRFAAYMAE